MLPWIKNAKNGKIGTPSSKIDEIIYLSIKTRKSEKKHASSGSKRCENGQNNGISIKN
jgi:hypothetical protein